MKLPGKIPAWAGQARNEAIADRVADGRKYYGDRQRLALECSGRRSPHCEYYVGLQGDQFFGGHSHPISVGGPANVQVAAITQLRQPLREPGVAGLSLRIGFVQCNEHADSPHAPALLRPPDDWPRRGAAKSCDKLPPIH